MKEKELIPVKIRTVKGRTICICHRAHECLHDDNCREDVVTRDKFKDWKATMRDRYGR